MLRGVARCFGAFRGLDLSHLYLSLQEQAAATTPPGVFLEKGCARHFGALGWILKFMVDRVRVCPQCPKARRSSRLCSVTLSWWPNGRHLGILFKRMLTGSILENPQWAVLQNAISNPSWWRPSAGISRREKHRVGTARTLSTGGESVDGVGLVNDL